MPLCLALSTSGVCCVKISAEGLDAYEYIESALASMEDEIDISIYSIEAAELFDILNYILKSSPWLFFVNSSFTYSKNSAGNIKILYPEYTMSRDERAEAFDFCLYELEKILFYMPSGMDEFDIVLYLHDYICALFEYDEECESRDMYGMLKNKKGTCQGYTYLFLELAKRSGLSCDVVYSDSMCHIWNIIKIDGEWYYIDLTWDDGNKLGVVSHKSFLFSDREAEFLGYYGYVTRENRLCVSEKYSGEYLNNISVPMAYAYGEWYFVQNSATVRAVSIYNEENDTAQNVISIDGYWILEDNKIFANCFSSAVSVLGDIYFNTKSKIYKYSHGERIEIYSVPSGVQIYYLVTDGKNIYFSDGENIDSFSVESDGDVDGDGKANLFDIVKLSLAIENNNLCNLNKPCADISGNAKIENEDLEMLRSMLVGQ